MAEKSTLRELDRGELLVREGDPVGTFHLVVRGELAVALAPDQGSPLAPEKLQRGDCFGELAVLEQEPSTRRVTAESVAAILCVKGDDFRALAQDEPGIGLSACKLFARSLRTLQQRLQAVEEQPVGLHGDEVAPPTGRAPLPHPS